VRVVYDPGHNVLPSATRRHPAGHGEGESVVVIRRTRESAPGRTQADRASAPEYVTSDEARRLDAQVRAHERTHQLALGPYAASGIQLTTRRAPGGEAIAVGGKIKADLDPVPGDPRATLRKANAVRRAALAVGSPSPADMRVAAEAYRMAREATEELQAQRLDTSA
jgi:hypothetical protein